MGKIAALLPQKRRVLVSTDPETHVDVRPLTLQEMLGLFVEHRKTFLSMYSAGIDKKALDEQLGVYILGAPELVAAVLEKALDAPGEAEDIKRLPPTVQLIALEAAWRLSVPDPKKAGELLSVVMAQLRTLSEKQKQRLMSQPLTTGQPAVLSSSAVEDTPY